MPETVEFVNEAYKHCKANAADREGADFIQITDAVRKTAVTGKDEKPEESNGVLINGNANEFIKTVAQHRFWKREKNR